MDTTRIILTLLLALVSGAAVTTARAADELTPAEEKFLRSRSAWSASALADLQQRTSPESLEATVREVLEHPLAIGERTDIDPATGEAAIHRFIKARVTAAGGEVIGTFEGRVAVPVNRPDDAGGGGVVEAGGERIDVAPLWPNGAMPSLAPASGLTGPLVDVGAGEWSDLTGRRLEGSICLMGFRGGRNWVRLFSQGARAVIVYDDGHINRENAERLFSTTPIPFPRYYAAGEAAARLREMARGDADATEPVTLRGGQVYQDRGWQAVFAYLPPTERIVYNVTPNDLLDRLATEFNTSTAELRRLNPSIGVDPPPGLQPMKLTLPGRDGPKYDVRADDLLARIAADFGVTPDALRKANDGLNGGLTAGQRVTVPNLDTAVTVMVPIDSVSVVPGEPHGLKVATNIAASLTLLDHLTASADVVRRRGVVFAFLDAETVGGLSSRALAEFTLRADGDYFGEAADRGEASIERGGIGGFIDDVSFYWGTIIVLAILVLGAGSTYLLTARGIEDRMERRKYQLRSLSIAAPLYLVLGLALGFLPQYYAARSQTSSMTNIAAGDYAAALAFIDQPASTTLDDRVGRWFVQEWLRTRVETARANIADEAVALKLALREEGDAASEGDAEVALVRAERTQELDRLEAWPIRLGELRDGTLDDMSLSWEARAKGLLDRLRAEEADYAPLGLSVASLRGRLEREYLDERRAEDAEANNLALIPALKARLRPGAAATADPTAAPVAAWYVDLSDGSASLGLRFAAGEFRDKLPAGKVDAGLNTRFRGVIGFARSELGWDEPWQFLTPADQAVHPVQATQPPVYGEFWQPLGVAVVPLGTLNDPQERLDTPRDIPDAANWQNLSTQARNTLLLLRLGLESPADAQVPAKLDPQQFGRLTGRTLRFNARSGISAQEPVPGTLVYSPGGKKKDADYAHNPTVYAGHRRQNVQITRLSGQYELPLESVPYANETSNPVVYAYHLDPEAAVFDMVVDRGQVGTQKQEADFKLNETYITLKSLVMTDVYPLVLFPGPDPVDYAAIGDEADNQQVEVVDAVRDGEPAHYAVDVPQREFGESGVPAMTLYMEAGRRARVVVRKVQSYKLLLTGLIDEDHPKGVGYLVGPVVDAEGSVTDRNLALTRTDIHIGQDMSAAARHLYEVMDQRGVRDASVLEALATARAQLERSEAAIERRDWLSAQSGGREAWGIMVRYYPRLLTLGREAVFSAVLLMALLVPASYFLERLLLGGKGVIRRLAGTTAIFSVGAVILNYLHPAFQISVSPFIVMIAFTMILMSTIVLFFSYARFDVLVRRARAAGGEAEEDRISLAGSLGTGLSLGVSNLKKRPSRTLLTAFTVTALTFSIVAFVSVKGQDALSTRDVGLVTQIGDEAVDPIPPKYQGVVFREYFWADMRPEFVDAIQSEFGGEYPIAIRGVEMQKEGGNNVAIEGVNQVEVRYGEEKAILGGFMGFEPVEREFSHLHEAVTNGKWFEEGDRYRVILPDEAAEQLGITPAMIYDGTPEDIAAGTATLKADGELPTVIFNNREWRVIGILDVPLADRYRDVTGQSLASVDFTRSGFNVNAAYGDLINEPPGFHMSWRRLVIVPMAAAAEVGNGMPPKSVAIRFDTPEMAQAFYDRVRLRLNRGMYGSVLMDFEDTDELAAADGIIEPVADAPPPPPASAQPNHYAGLALITTATEQSIAGLAKVIVPVILCVLIVLNTMLGTVEERKGEVYMLGAVGLSPGQISFLLLSESLVYSVLGIVLGLIAGLTFGWLVAFFNPTGDPAGFMGGLSLNFASLWSMVLALTAGVVVLAATLFPARKAAALAAPSGMDTWDLPEPEADGVTRFRLPFTLTRGNAVGMLAFFRGFLLNHTDAAAEDFNCRDVTAAAEITPRDALAVTCTMWLAPYDLDVSQAFDLRIVPADPRAEGASAPDASPTEAKTFEVQITLRRLSGSEDAWVRTNHRLMNLVRHQFLLWRNLSPDERAGYIERGADLLRAETPPVAISSPRPAIDSSS